MSHGSFVHSCRCLSAASQYTTGSGDLVAVDRKRTLWFQLLSLNLLDWHHSCAMRKTEQRSRPCPGASSPCVVTSTEGRTHLKGDLPMGRKGWVIVCALSILLLLLT